MPGHHGRSLFIIGQPAKELCVTDAARRRKIAQTVMLAQHEFSAVKVKNAADRFLE